MAKRNKEIDDNKTLSQLERLDDLPLSLITKNLDLKDELQLRLVSKRINQFVSNANTQYSSLGRFAELLSQEIPPTDHSKADDIYIKLHWIVSAQLRQIEISSEVIYNLFTYF